jgi:RNA polymerase sigma factor (sigma-70 family)
MRRRHLPHGKWVESDDPEVRQIWYSRDDELEQIPRLEPNANPAYESDPLHKRDVVVILHSLLSQLTQRSRLVLAMRYLHDMSYKEIGDELCVTRERVRQMELAALRKLKFNEMNNPDKNVRSFFA